MRGYMNDKEPGTQNPGPQDIESFPSWPLAPRVLKNEPSYYIAEPSLGYGLGEHGGIIFTGVRLKSLNPYSRNAALLDEWLADYGPEVRIRMPKGGIVAGKTYLLSIEAVGNEEYEETVDAYWFAFTEKTEGVAREPTR